MDKLAEQFETLDGAPSNGAESGPSNLDDPKLYLNRELSLLEFFHRVLVEAQDERNPLLERVKFLAIVGSNLDEFFMVRVAGLKQQIEAGVVELSPDGLTPAEQLAAIRKAVGKLMREARDCLRSELLPKLNEAGIHLLDYAELNDKQVAVLVELKARFDEESNIGWAKRLEAEGVHVVYGLLGLKTHSKIALVVRREGEGLRRYVHMATGNYNGVTAQLYTDLGLFTSNDDIGADATDLFNYLTGYSAKKDYRKLLVAPINLRTRLEALIRREIEHQQRGEKGRLIFKVNVLVDRHMIKRLYQASQAGVKVELVVRSVCCLRPGVPGVSENIRVTSVVGRFLEHSRLYYFRNGGQEEIYLGSADLMTRNLDRRVEILFPVENARLIRHLRDEVLAAYLADNVKASDLQPDGTYERRKPEPGQPAVNSQGWLLSRAAGGREG